MTGRELKVLEVISKEGPIDFEAIHYHPDVWGDDPGAAKLDRALDNLEDRGFIAINEGAAPGRHGFFARARGDRAVAKGGKLYKSAIAASARAAKDGKASGVDHVAILGPDERYRVVPVTEPMRGAWDLPEGGDTR